MFSFSLLLTQLLLDMNITFIKYTPLPYMDFTIFDNISSLDMLNKTYSINLNLKSGVLIDTIYTFLFFILGLISFIRKDIRS